MSRRPLYLILLAALALRAGLAAGAWFATRNPAVFTAPDTGSYLRPARALLQTGRFETNGQPEIVRTPGYSVFLIPGLLLGGDLTTVVLQILLGCATAYLTYRLAGAVWGDQRAALGAALLCAVEPVSVLYCSKILSETVFAFLIVLSLLRIAQYLKANPIGAMTRAGVAMALATYVRPVSYYLPALLGLLLLAPLTLRRARRPGRRIVRPVAAFVAMALVLTVIWRLRNSVEAGYDGFAAISDVNLYFYQAASVLAAREGVSYYDMQKRMGYDSEAAYLERHPEQRDWPAGRRYKFMRRKAIRIVLESPFAYAKIHLKGVALILLDPGATEYLRLFDRYPRSGGLLGAAMDQGLVRTVVSLARERPLVFGSNLLLAAILAALYLLAGLGLWARRREMGLAAGVLLVSAGYFVLISGGPMATHRFRHAIAPIVCVFAGAGVAALASRRRTTPLTDGPMK